MGAVLAVPGTLICGVITALGCACNIWRCCCTGGMGTKGVTKNVAKFLYVMFLGLATVIAYIIGLIGENSYDTNPGGIFSFTIECADITGVGDACAGDPAIYRASCASVFFFSVMLLGTIPRPTFSGDKNWVPLLGEGFHRGYWGIKTVIFFGLLIGSFFFPSDFFNNDTYRDVARVVSVFFLCVQILVLVDFAYSWNDNWIERAYEDDDDEPTSKGWLYALLFFSAILYIAAIGGLVSLFIFYSSCSLAMFYASMTAGFFILYTGLSFFNIYVVNVFVLCCCREPYDYDDERGNISIAPASVVGVYCVYLLWSALRSNPDPSAECTPFGDFLEDNGLEIFIGIAFASLSLVWTALAAGSNAPNLLKGDRSDNEVNGLGGGAYQVGEDENGKAIYSGGSNDDDEDDGDTDLWLFHFLMITASFYMAMVLTNWGVDAADVVTFLENATSIEDVEFQGDVGLLSMWVKIAAQWGASLLFIWTIVAPYVLEEYRDF